MKKGKSFDNLLTDLHSDNLQDDSVSVLSLQSDGVVELTPLTLEEANRLAACEQTINEGLTTFLAVGNALIEIRQHKLYRADYRTFETYCRERFQLKRQRAYELMGAADVVNSLSEISDKDLKTPLPERESHASALSPLPITQRQEIWKQVTREGVETQHPITASQIKTVIDREAGRPKPISQESAHPAGDKAIGSGVTAHNTHYLKQIKKAVITAKSEELRIEVRGSWLVRHGLEDAWRQLRGQPDWVINNRFKDTLTLSEAKLLGIIR
jgi:hypothetical protein